MRMAIKVSDEHRAKLLELAAKRGKKGFSEIVAEALAVYFEAARNDETRRREALQVRGSLAAGDADRLRKATAALRAAWS